MSEPTSKSVMVAIPSRGTPQPVCFNSAHQAAAAAREHGFTKSIFIYPAGAPRDWNRNRCVQMFLDHPDHLDYLWFIDDDTQVPLDAIYQLAALDKDIVVGPQPLYLNGMVVANVSEGLPTLDEPTSWPAWVLWDENREPFRIGACGFGCVLIKRHVLEAIGQPYFVENYGDVYGNRSQTEDIDFCRRAKEHGFEIWCHPGVVCGHYKTVDLRDFVDRKSIEVTDLTPEEIRAASAQMEPAA